MNIIKYYEKLTFYIGRGGNSILLLSEDGRKALLIDTKYFGAARELRKEVTAKEVTIINTHFHIDHPRGNKLYPESYVISGICPWKLWDFDSRKSKRPDKVLNPGEEYRFKFDDEWVRMINNRYA